MHADNPAETSARRRATWLTVVGALLLAMLIPFAPHVAKAATNPCGPPVTSVIACENSLPGDPESDWGVPGVGDASIQGFATSMSVNVGDTETFKISTNASSYHFDILRIGYYQGNGARKIASGLRPTAALPQTQPACRQDSTSGLIDCGNWGVSASWTVPTNAVSGLYIAHLIRDDTGGNSQITFVVRNDASHSDMLFQTSDETWQAYNTYGGNSLYQCTVACPPGNPGGYKAAYKVSYNRPFHSPLDDNGASWWIYAEYPMIRYLERNGYDLSYTSGLDVATRGPLLLNHKIFLSTGHDEYWSGQQRANVEAARDAGVNLAFFSGNEVFWKTRWENSIDGSNTPNRTLVTYKETHFDAPVDPQDPPTWTGTWRDPRFSPPADAKPENALTGQFFIVNSGTTSITVPSQYAGLRFWRNTAAAKLTSGQSLTLGSQTLGYEWDEDVDNGYRPRGLIDMSSTTSTVEVFPDYGTTTTTGPATHHLTLYRAQSGALVFGAGTVQWAWGLDNDNPFGVATNVNMQQAAVNLFADMGVQPTTLMSGLVAATQSTDTTAPTSTVTSPNAGATLADGAKVTVTGTATDTGGGIVAGVEVSTDGGQTWHPATGTSSWSYTWVAHGSPSTTILSRATDDSANVGAPSPAVAVNVSCPCSIFGTGLTPAGISTAVDSADGNAIEVGMKFRSDTFGTVNGVRFYKATTNTGTHLGHLWTASGQLLGSVTFTNETSSGWQQANFSTPVSIFPNTTYVVSYFAPSGHYSQTDGYWYPPPAPEPDGDDSVDSPPLHALRNSNGTTNGLYVYGGSAFPNNTFNAENYWVDAVFSPAGPPGQATNVVASAGNASAGLTWSAAASGGPATTYTITPYIGSTAQPTTTVTGTPAPTSAIVTGLVNGNTYTFTVTASNPNGAAPPSAPSAPVDVTSGAPFVQNGGFENTLTFWTPGGTALPVASSTRAHSGTTSALLGTASGSEPLGDSSLSQTVAVPSIGTSTLSFWYWPQSTDGACSGSTCQFDWTEAQIRDSSGATLASVFKNNTNAQAWTQVTFDLTKYDGQNVTLWFNVHEDGAVPADDTAMWVDDVTVTNSQPTAPAPPTNVQAVARDASASVSWTAPSNGGSAITSYTVTPFIGQTAQQKTTVTGSPPATSTTVTGLTNGTTYTFTVAATNGVGTGLASAPSNSVTPSPPTAPLAPTNVAAVAGNTSAAVSWTAPSDGGSPITGYTVTPFIGSTAQPPTTVTGSPPATKATVTGLTNGTSYTFTVAATNAIGTGPPSAQSSPVTPSNIIPPAFVQSASAHNGSAGSLTASLTRAIGSNDRIVVETGSWSSGGATVSGVTDSAGNAYVKLTSFKAPDGTEMAVWTAPVTKGAGSTLTVTATATATTDLGLTALDYSGLSTVGDASIVDQLKTAAGTTGSATTVSSGATAATTAGNELAIGFYNDSGFGASLTAGGGFTSRANMSPTADMEMLVEDTIVGTGATPNAAVGTAANTTWAMATIVLKSATGAAPSAPGTPTGVGATAGNASATVSWTAPSNGGSPITSYTVTTLVGGVAQGTTPVTGSPPATSVTVTGLTNGTTYTFTVSATNAVGTGPTSAQSNSVTPSGPTLPGAPTNVVASAGNGSATVSWTAPSSGGSAITSYTITPFIGTVAQPTKVVTGSPPATSTTITGLTNGTVYTFTVFATNAVGDGPQSAPSNSVTPTAPTAPGAPTGVSAVAGNGSATVSWTAPSNGGSPITSYTVTPFVGGTPQQPTTITGTPPATSTIVSGLTNGTAYTFTVFATNSVGDGPASAASNSVTPTAAAISIDKSVSKDAKGTLTTASFSTTAAGELLVAYVGFDGPPGSGKQTVTVSGAGLTWTLARRTNTQSGDVEIWWAKATGTLTGVTVTAAPKSGGYQGSLTVLTYKNASGVGSTAGAASASGPPDVAVTNVAASSWVFAVGNDWDNANARTPATGQVLQHQYLAPTGDTMWVQSTAAPAAGSGTIDISDTSPTTDQWNFAAVEIRQG